MSIIDEVKQKLDVVELIGQYVQLQKSGRNFRALCPFHSEKTPSFFVFPEQQSWHCFGACGTGGDIYSFLMKKEGVDFGQALRTLAEKAGVTLVNPEFQSKEDDEKKERLIRINEAAAAYFHHLLLNTSIGERARNYLEQRSIFPQTIKDFQLGFSKDSFEDIRDHLLNEGYNEAELLAAGLVLEREGGGSYDRFRNRLMFPIRDIEGHAIGFGARAMDESLPKYLNSPQSPVFDKSSTLYAIDRAKSAIRKQNLAIIMEGYMDVLSAHQHGWNNTVASMGTALTEKQLSSLKKLTKNLILALDADIAGSEATLRMAETIDIENYLHAEVKVVVPSHGKDPDEEIRKEPTLWTQSLEKARPLADFILDTTRTTFDLGSSQEKALAAERLLKIISKIDDPIRRGDYIQKLSLMAKIRPNDLRDRINKLRIDERKRKATKTVSLTPSKSVSLSSNYIEDYCLGLLLQYPILRIEGVKLNKELFEFSETREIFSKWQRNADVISLKDSLDSALHPYLDSLLNKIYIPELEDENKQSKVLNDCVMRLQENLLRSMEFKKAVLLSIETETSGEKAGLAKVEELGTEESKQLKHVFDKQSQRRHSSV